VNEVSDEKTTKPTTKRLGTLASLGLDDVSYLIVVSKEKFELAKFKRAVRPLSEFPVELPSSPDAGWHTIYPEHPESLDVYINFSWYTEESEITLMAQYSSDGKRSGKNKSDPHAEKFMQWLGKFFKYESAEAHSHAHFQYLLESKQSKFPLPLKTHLGDGDAEIDGIALRLPSKPQGVSRVRLSQGKKCWFVEMICDRKLIFNDFDPYKDAQAYMPVLDSVMEDRKT